MNSVDPQICENVSVLGHDGAVLRNQGGFATLWPFNINQIINGPPAECSYLPPSLFLSDIGGQVGASEFEFPSCVTNCNGSSSLATISPPRLSSAYALGSGSVFDNQAKVSVDTSPIPLLPEHLRWSCFQEVAESTSRVNDSEQLLESYLSARGTVFFFVSHELLTPPK
jgi:hypothetical protein